MLRGKLWERNRMAKSLHPGGRSVCFWPGTRRYRRYFTALILLGFLIGSPYIWCATRLASTISSAHSEPIAPAYLGTSSRRTPQWFIRWLRTRRQSWPSPENDSASRLHRKPGKRGRRWSKPWPKPGEVELAEACVPECVACGGVCPELKPCGWKPTESPEHRRNSYRRKK